MPGADCRRFFFRCLTSGDNLLSFFSDKASRDFLAVLGLTVLITWKWKMRMYISPKRAKFTTSIELGIVWPPTWLELARIGSSWLEFDHAQIFAQLEPIFPPFGHLSQLKPTLAKLFCYCYVTARPYSEKSTVSCDLTRLGGIVWPPADASFDFVTWLELAWVGSTVWPGLKGTCTAGLKLQAWPIDRKYLWRRQKKITAIL